MAFPFILCQSLFAADASQYLCWLVLPEGHEGFPGSPQHTVSVKKRRAWAMRDRPSTRTRAKGSLDRKTWQTFLLDSESKASTPTQEHHRTTVELNSWWIQEKNCWVTIRQLTNSMPDWPPLGPGPTVQQNAMADSRFQSHSCQPLIGPIRATWTTSCESYWFCFNSSVKGPHTSWKLICVTHIQSLEHMVQA